MPVPLLIIQIPTYLVQANIAFNVQSKTTKKVLRPSTLGIYMYGVFIYNDYPVVYSGTCIHREYRSRAGQGLARTKGLIAISPCRSLHAKLVCLAICRLRLFVQEPAHTVLPLIDTVALYRIFGVAWCNRHCRCKSPRVLSLTIIPISFPMGI